LQDSSHGQTIRPKQGNTNRIPFAACTNILFQKKKKKKQQQYAELFINDAILSEQSINKQLGEAIASLWQDPTVQGIVQQSATYQILDSAP